MDDLTLAFTSAVELAPPDRATASVSPVEVVEALLRRIERRQPDRQRLLHRCRSTRRWRRRALPRRLCMRGDDAGAAPRRPGRDQGHDADGRYPAPPTARACSPTTSRPRTPWR